MHFNFFTKLFQKSIRNASSTIITNTTSPFTNRTYYIPNHFVQQMNKVNPQLTGYMIEAIVSYLFHVQSTRIDLQQVLNTVQTFNHCQSYPELYNIMVGNYNNLAIFIKYINNIVFQFLEYNKHNVYIPVQSQENLSFKQMKCCKRKAYKCFADIVFNSIILDIKVVRQSFYLKSNINSELTYITNLNSIGIKYYNQLMIYACGFFKKYTCWPAKLIVFNVYTGETIVWSPTLHDYESFLQKL